MNYTQESLNERKSLLLKKIDEIHILNGTENYQSKYSSSEESNQFLTRKESVDKIDIVNIREFFRRNLNIVELVEILSSEELTDVQNAYDLSRTRVKILYGLPLS
jgi:hypothetical protein